MELKPGYKQTDVGVIPEEWEVRSVTSIGSVIRGASPRPKGDKRFYGGDVPRLMVEDVTRDKKLVTPMIDFLTPEGAKLSRTCRRGTLTVVCSGTPKVVGLPSFLAVDACIHDGMLALVQLDKAVEPDFLFYQLTSLQERLHAAATHGGTFVNLTTAGFSSFTFALPPSKAEQEAIAAALGDVDALIASLDKLIAKKRDIKQAAMRELLRPKDGWVPRTLGNIADPNQRWSFTGGPFGSNLKSSDYTADGVRIIQLQNIGEGVFLNDREVFTSAEKANELLSCNIFPGDIILSKMGDPVARACIIPTHHERYLMCSDGIRLAVDQKQFNTFFVYTAINSPAFRTLAENASTGSTRKRIGLAELRNLELFCPGWPEQTTIATVLSDMDAEIASLETRRDKTRALKQGMMQELLTGRIRLIRADKA